MSLEYWWVPLVVVTIPALIVGILVAGFWPRRQSGLGPRLAPGQPAGTIPVEGTWNVSVVQGLLGTTTGWQGRIDITAGRVSFIGAGDTEPEWSYPCRAVTIELGPQIGFGLTPERLNTPDGQVAFVVSQESINRFSANTIKSARLAGYARDFRDTFLAAGGVSA